MAATLFLPPSRWKLKDGGETTFVTDTIAKSMVLWITSNAVIGNIPTTKKLALTGLWDTSIAIKSNVANLKDSKRSEQTQTGDVFNLLTSAAQ